MNIQRTNYGEKQKGKSRFIIVAPHAGRASFPSPAYDDENTEKIAKNIAKKLEGSFVINKKYIKPKEGKKSRKDMGFNPNILKDFNSIIRKCREGDWDKDLPTQQMGKFYKDIEEIAKSINKPIIVFIHGMKDKYGIDIDIGCGLKYDKVDGILKGTKGPSKHPNAGKNSGNPTASERNMQKLEIFFGKCRLKAGIGKKFSAWSKTNAIQYCSKFSNECFQLEIANKWRQKNNFIYISTLIVKALGKIY